MSILQKGVWAMLFIFCTAGIASAQMKKKQQPADIMREGKRWADSIYNGLTEEERIGQLFMVAAYSGGKNYNEELISRLIAAHHLGGLIFMQGGPLRQAMLTNKYQRAAQVPLLISMDAEWGLGMRLDSVKNFPRQMMLGAAHDTGIVYRMGMAIALQCRRLGVHIDFAPDVDVNNNPANPVINSRSFGEDKTWVARLGVAYMNGLQNNGIIACAKHFPGHGDTNVDSHKDLPLIPRSLAQLDTLELYPFKRLIAAGVKSVMVAHLEVPALDTAAHVPTTLSANAVTGLLKNKLGFDGLVITDALNMQGVAKYFPAGEADLRAFEAGNDILLFPGDVPAAIGKIKSAIDIGIIPPIALETSVKKILRAKYEAGLADWQDIDTTNLLNDLNQYIDPIRMQAAKAAITLVKDDNQVLSRIAAKMHIAYVGINVNSVTPLYQSLACQNSNMKASWLPKGSPADSAKRILESLSGYDGAIIAIHNINFTPGNNYGIGDEAISFLEQASARDNTMIVLMGNAYATQYFCGSNSILVAYEDDSLTETVVADVLMKKIKAKGRLPVTACLNGKSIVPVVVKQVAPPVVTVAQVLSKATSAEAGVISPEALDKLDRFIGDDIAAGVFPGCRLLASKNGKVFYDKAFGHQEYDKRRPVDSNTLYDMASCTKVLATTLAVMRLYEEGKLDLNLTLGSYLPITSGTNKEGLVIRDLLLHQAGLKSWIPFYKETLNPSGKPDKALYRKKHKGNFTIPVAAHLYLRKDYPDTMWSRILASPLENKGKSVYSDLDFYFLAAVVERLSGMPVDQYVEEQFYKPLGLKHILYDPLRRFDTVQIAPTEYDVAFRGELVHGYVHDPGAAMLGGVAGHAGIFATAADAAVIMQMLLNKGLYGGDRYFKPATVDLFTAYHSALSHRGYGFDKPAADADNGGPAGDRCSAQAFGHQGFTGTCVWADPATGIVFVFLSNRVYPSAENTKINKLNVRTVAQDYIYESLGIPVNHDRQLRYREQTGAGR